MADRNEDTTGRLARVEYLVDQLRAVSPAAGTPPYNPAWYALTDIYLDPVNGKDSNTGASPSSPIKTVAEMVRRYGSVKPQMPFAQNLTIHQLSSQTAGVDAFFFNPVMNGPGSFVWKATATHVGGTFSPTTVTAKVQTAVGNNLEMTGALPAGIAAGQIVRNITKSSSAMVAIFATGVATLTQPVPDATLDTDTAYNEDNTWANTDTYQLQQGLICNWQNPAPTLGSSSANYQVDSIVLSFQGSAGFEDFIVSPTGGALRFTRCNLMATGGTVILVINNSGGTAQLACCTAQSSVIGGASTQYFPIVFGSYIHGLEAGSGCILDGDTIVDSFCILGAGNITLGAVSFTASSAPVTVAGTAVLQETVDLVPSIVWGGGTLNVAGGAIYQNGTGSSFASTLKLAGLELDGVATGSSFNSGAASNPYTAGISITSANLDAGGAAGNPGLQNPRTGSRFALS